VQRGLIDACLKGVKRLRKGIETDFIVAAWGS
jgi:hypothetical protein